MRRPCAGIRCSPRLGPDLCDPDPTSTRSCAGSRRRRATPRSASRCSISGSPPASATSTAPRCSGPHASRPTRAARTARRRAAAGALRHRAPAAAREPRRPPSPDRADRARGVRARRPALPALRRRRSARRGSGSRRGPCGGARPVRLLRDGARHLGAAAGRSPRRTPPRRAPARRPSRPAATRSTRRSPPPITLAVVVPAGVRRRRRPVRARRPRRPRRRRDPRGQLGGRAPAAADPDAVRARARRPDAARAAPTRSRSPARSPAGRPCTAWARGSTWSSHFAVATRAAFDGVPARRGLAATLADPDERAVFEADPGLRGGLLPRRRARSPGAISSSSRRSAPPSRRWPPAARRPCTGVAVGAAYVEGLRAAGSPITTEDLARHEAAIAAAARGRVRATCTLRVAPPNSPGLVAAADPGRRSSGWASTPTRAVPTPPRGPGCSSPPSATSHGTSPTPTGWRSTSRPCSTTATSPRSPTRSGARSAAGGPTVKPGGDTIALVAADAEGHAVSLIQSLFHGFGAGSSSRATGIVAHDRGACFTLDAGAAERASRPARSRRTRCCRRSCTTRTGSSASPARWAATSSRRSTRRRSRTRSRWAPTPARPSRRRGSSSTTSRRTAAPARRGRGERPGRGRRRDRGGGVRGASGSTISTASVGHAHLIRVHADGRLDVGSDPRADGGALAD